MMFFFFCGRGGSWSQRCRNTIEEDGFGESERSGDDIIS